MKADVFQIKQAIPCTCGESAFEWEFEDGKFTKINPMLPYTMNGKKVTYKCPKCGAAKELHVDELAGCCNFPRIVLNSEGEMSWKCYAHGYHLWPLGDSPDDLIEALQRILDADSDLPCCIKDEFEAEKRRENSAGNTCIRCGMPDMEMDLYEIPVRLENGKKSMVALCCNCYEDEDLFLAFCDECHRWHNEGCSLSTSDMFISKIEKIDGETVYTLSNTNDYCERSFDFSCSNDWMDKLFDF